MYVSKHTLGMHSLHVIIIELQCCVAAETLEANYVICIVVHFGANFPQRQITCADVVHHEDIALNLFVILATDTCARRVMKN